MKKRITSLLLLTILFYIPLLAQNVINVTPNEVNALSNAVKTAQAGDVFVLERGGLYFNQGRIDVNVPITIKANDGDGALPLVQQAPKNDGKYSGEDFKLFADATFINLHFNGIRKSRSNATGRAIRLGTSQVKLTVDGCVFERYWLRTIGLNDKDSSVIHYTNNIHLWDGKEDRIDNGRFLDCRAASVDSLFVINNTFLNCNDRFIRHMGGGLKPIKYAKIDHNTFYGNIGYRPPFQFRLIEELEFTNNIIANVGLLGTDSASNRLDEIAYQEPKAICIFTISGTDSVNTNITMRNNNVFTEQRFKDLLSVNPDTVQAAPLFNKEWADRIDEATAVQEEELTFAKAPSLDSLVAEIQNYFQGGTNWSNTGFITRTEVLAPEEVNMNYGTAASSYTAADNGLPLGDLNWYPDKKQEWITGVEEINSNIPSKFTVKQNYPNPFNPTTNIEFSIPLKSKVSLKVFNVLGQEVAQLVNKELAAGNYNVNFDASNLTSGIYFYTLSSSNFTQTKKMILLQ